MASSKFMSHRPKRRGTTASKTAKSLTKGAHARIVNNLGYDPTKRGTKSFFGAS